MNRANLTPERRVQLPYLLEGRAALADLILKGFSYFSLAGRMGPLIDEIQHYADSRLDDTVQRLKDLHKPAGIESYLLLLSLPRTALASILLGTVAYDAVHGKIDQYSADGPGVYVLGISLADQGGAFLNAVEMAQFVQDLERYINDATPSAKGVQNPPQSDFVGKVDQQYGIHTGGPRFIRSESALHSMGLFLESMKRRLAELQAADPTGQLRSHQSPLYVGCAVHVKSRTLVYASDQSNASLQSANNPYGLTMSLLHMAKLKPRETLITAIRTWKSGQLGLAENLVAALAGSYVELGGFNIQQGGQHKHLMTPTQVTEAETYMFLTEPHLFANLEHSDKEREQYEKLAEANKKTDEALDAFGGLDAPGVLADIASLRVEADTVMAQTRELIKRGPEIAQAAEAWERHNERLVQERETMEDIWLLTRAYPQEEGELAGAGPQDNDE